MSQLIAALEETIRERKTADPKESYVAKLFSKGRKKMAQKVAEEGAEVAIAAVSEGREALVSEVADLMFHVLVLCSDEGIPFDEIVDELANRQGISGLEEKAKRKAES